ncbi:glycoside hydrolase family 128 protein [Durotheca rogersii]|uniref:glycoside hydrolase family 128 protein n=1 Tax=Durotheca rogersii TaxID=419775 RepID=UPI002220E88C|nr:glycoside hydrolase family 128 protein [Durotheca rogersii]KAI5863990.1 glycoside hydrolase family 128 protein [Durotheca rogersii]
MVIKKRQILWDWTNTGGGGNPGIPDKINQVPFGGQSPVASVVNWNAWVPPELKDRAPFRPMVRVLENTRGGDWNIIQNTKYPIILFFNEPERAGISPEQAKDIWYNQLLPLRRNKGKKLGSPAVASDDNGRKWIERFMSLVANDPPDYLCLHYYSKRADDAIKYIQDMHNKWPKHKVMVTEIACIDRDYKAVLAFTVKVCNWLDSQDWVFEYGLFDFQRKVADSFVSPAAQLMDGNGNFTELGKMYVHQQPLKLPGQAGAFENVFISLDAGVLEEEKREEEKKDEEKKDGEKNGEEKKDEEKKDEEEEAVESKTGSAVAHDPDDTAFLSASAATNGGEEEVFGIAAALSPDQQKALDAHNAKRRGKGVPALAWDGQLAKNAQDYANHLARIGRLEHSRGDQRPNQGENLAWSSGSSQTPLLLGTKMWLDEEKNYRGQPIGQGDFGSYGHYTQCLWKSTTKLGMAAAKDAKGGVYIVGRYSPPGNFTGQKPY